MLSAIFLLLGFIPLIYGSDLLIDNASALAKKLNIPSLVIGLTIVAFGTSAPELVVNTLASIKGNSDIVLGNIIGSNIFNIALILGIATMITPIIIKKSTVFVETPYALFASVLIILLAFNVGTSNDSRTISRIDGIILLFFFLVFLAYTARSTMKGTYESDIEIVDKPLWLSMLLLLIGLALLIIGGKIIVEFAIRLAREFKISERIIAITIVSVGTSLPELATSIIAAKKRQFDIAIGNIVGSNIFNIFLILGISTTIQPIAISTDGLIDTFICAGITFLLLLFSLGKQHQIGRIKGLVFFLVYVGYIAFLFMPK